MKNIIYQSTEKRELHKGVAPVPSKSLIPEWYKKIPPFIGNEKRVKVRNGIGSSTVKNCIPFLDALTAGYMFVASEDIAVDWEGGMPHFNWKTTREAITDHSPEQTNILPVPIGYHSRVFKFANQYVIESPKNYSLLVTHPHNRYDLPFLTISGFVDTDIYPLAIQFPFFIREGWEGIIEKGTPLAQLIPVKREKWHAETREIDTDKFERNHFNFFARIDRAYKNLVWQKKSYN